jgi:hypothetical protein
MTWIDSGSGPGYMSEPPEWKGDAMSPAPDPKNEDRLIITLTDEALAEIAEGREHTFLLPADPALGFPRATWVVVRKAPLSRVRGVDLLPG